MEGGRSYLVIATIEATLCEHMTARWANWAAWLLKLIRDVTLVDNRTFACAFQRPSV